MKRWITVLWVACCVLVRSTGAVEPSGQRVMNSERSNPLVVQAIADLGHRESADAAEIELLRFEEVVWPDGSMGCPHPGMRYRQVPQDGALIVLRLRGREYHYHSGGNQPPFLCEGKITGPVAPRPAKPGPILDHELKNWRDQPANRR